MLTIPLAVPVRTPAPPMPIEGSATLLLVDDDPDLLRLLSIRLKANGYSVHAVDSGARALAAIGAARPDLVLTDLRMNGMDGMALFHEIQASYPGLPVIILTAHGTIPDAVDAVKYSPRGATVRLALELRPAELEFSVIDRGIGIPAEDQARLFETFQRARNVGNIEGTGLGLAIARQCAELHGGIISFASEAGRGSTFRLHLPVPATD